MTPQNSLNEVFFDSKVYRPIIYRLNNANEKKALDTFLEQHEKDLIIHDQMNSIINEFIKISFPYLRENHKALNEKVTEFIADNPLDSWGCWVYYPWKRTIVHLPPEEVFIQLRTSRNQYKITPQEQEILSNKTIGVIGLSVGQTVAITAAMERVCGTLKMADFDELDLSNLNRLRAGVFEIALPKCTIAAREIAEIDPFIKVDLFFEGITPGNIDEFIQGKNPVDVLIEECDSIPIKILSREKAREAGIPVIMDTSDRGLLDVERFDVEPKRPLFHGIIPGLSSELLQSLPPEQRLPLTIELVGGTQISNRIKASMLEVGATIPSWPQLASSIMLGGGIATEAARKILLNDDLPSGRYYFDGNEIFKKDRTQVPNPKEHKANDGPYFLNYKSSENNPYLLTDFLSNTPKKESKDGVFYNEIISGEDLKDLKTFFEKACKEVVSNPLLHEISTRIEGDNEAFGFSKGFSFLRYLLNNRALKSFISKNKLESSLKNLSADSIKNVENIEVIYLSEIKEDNLKKVSENLSNYLIQNSIKINTLFGEILHWHKKQSTIDSEEMLNNISKLKKELVNLSRDKKNGKYPIGFIVPKP